MSCTEKRVGKMTAGELYGCVLRVAKIKGIKMAEPTGQSTLEILKEKFPEITAEQWESCTGRCCRNFLEEKKSKVRSREKNNRSGRENFTAGFLKLRSGI